jgi:hypothetical protein
MNTKTDQKTLDLIQEVQKQKKEIQRIEKPSWKTNSTFSYFEGNMSNTINLRVVSSVKEMIQLAGFLSDKMKSFQHGREALGLPSLGTPGTEEFTWSGFSYDDWIEDMKKRIDQIQLKTKRDKLTALETRLNAIISPELRAQMELEAIEKELS